MNSIHYGYNNNNGKSGSTTSRGRTESPASRVKYPSSVLGHQKQAQQLHPHHQYTTENNHQSLINRSTNITTPNFASSMGANKSSSVMNKQTLFNSNKFYTSSVSNPTSVNNEYYTQQNNRLVAINGNLNRRNLNLSSNKTIFESTVISNNNYPFVKSSTIQPSAQQINSNKSSKHLSTINKLNMNNLNEDMNSLNLNAGTNSISLYASKNKYQEDYYVDNSKLIRSNQKITNSATNENSNGPSQFFAAKSSNISSSSTSSSSSSTSSSSSSSPPLPNNVSYLHRKSSQNVAAAVGANDNNFDDLNSKGLAGLKNLGNTCFMNSILQCLGNTKPLVEYCLKSSYMDDLNITLSVMKGSLFRSYAILIKNMWKSNEIVVPQEFRSQIIKFAPKFVGYAQHDAEEFLNYLLKGLHEDVNLVKKKASIKFDEQAWDKMTDTEKSEQHWSTNLRIEKSRISDLFSGQLKSTLKCTKCDYRSPTFEVFWHLPVPIPNKSHPIKLDDCIKLFMAEETLDGDDKPNCSKCKEKRRSVKWYTIERLPKILVIQLKRFLKAHYTQKIEQYVDYPIEDLDMSKYLSKNVELGIYDRPQSNCLYDLYAISLHSGSGSSGHYVAYCKHPFTKKWHYFNDSSVREIQISSLRDPNAYILFYQMKS